MKAWIWMDVTCKGCGRAEGFFYQNSNSVSALKKITKGWVHTIDGNFCPECQKEKKHLSR